jgi:hypothetical protein
VEPGSGKLVLSLDSDDDEGGMESEDTIASTESFEGVNSNNVDTISVSFNINSTPEVKEKSAPNKKINATEGNFH